MTDREYNEHYKQAQKYKIIVTRRQEKFDRQNDLFVRNILSGLDTVYMSQDIIDSIEENSLMQHYHKLRILAAEQSKYFNKH